MANLQLVVVTPETTLLDEPVSAVRLPLYDGLAGILPGRAPMVGRLGIGELTLTSSAGTRSFFVDGGFVQVKGAVVSVITQRAVAADAVDRAEADRMLSDARAMRATTDQEFDEKERAIDRARGLITVASRS